MHFKHFLFDLEHLLFDRHPTRRRRFIFAVDDGRIHLKGNDMKVQAPKGSKFRIDIAGVLDDGSSIKAFATPGVPSLSVTNTAVAEVSEVVDNGDFTFHAFVTLIGDAGASTTITAVLGNISGTIDVAVKAEAPVAVATKLVITAAEPAEVVAEEQPATDAGQVS